MIKILIVDDSITERMLLQSLFESEKDMTVIGFAKNGAEAVKLAGELKPDLITMDVNMPIMDGLEATRLIMMQHPVPIVVISTTVDNAALNTTFRALEAGALSVLGKPIDLHSPDSQDLRQQIIQTIRSMSEIKVIKRRFNTKAPKNIEIQAPPKIHYREYKLIAIGTSVGGPQALKIILSRLPADFSVPIVIVQHMTVGFMQGFTEWLNHHIALIVKCAEHNEELKKGVIYFAPDNYHLTVVHIQESLIAKLTQSEPVSSFRPSATVLLQSVAKSCGQHAIGILLTGMGNDGVQGLLEIKKENGHTIIQDQESCVVFGMAGVAQTMGAVDKVVNLDEMAAYLLKIV